MHHIDILIIIIGNFVPLIANRQNKIPLNQPAIQYMYK